MKIMTEDEELMRCAILDLTPQALQDILQLPDGCEVVDVICDIEHRGLVRVKIVGAGWKTAKGAAISHAGATCSKDEHGKLTIDWGFQ